MPFSAFSTLWAVNNVDNMSPFMRHVEYVSHGVCHYNCGETPRISRLLKHMAYPEYIILHEGAQNAAQTHPADATKVYTSENKANEVRKNLTQVGKQLCLLIVSWCCCVLFLQISQFIVCKQSFQDHKGLHPEHRI